MAEVFEPKYPRTRNSIIGEGVKRDTIGRQGVHIKGTVPKKPDKKSSLKRGVYDA